MIEQLAAVARQVGDSLARWRAENRVQGEWQGAQFKAEADRHADELWQNALQILAPGSAVLSEENAASHAVPLDGNYWLLDPLDGTASFAGGFPGWVTQVAWMERGRPTLAAVYAPLLDEMFLATAGGGATLNGQKLHAATDEAPRSLIDNYPQPRGIAAEAMRQLGIERYVECGSIGLKICKVAAGAADVFIKDVVVRTWDVAPAALILAEAGGCLTGLDGRPFAFADQLECIGLIAARAKATCMKLAVGSSGS
jgi:3'(2'), 5'-bisphosphate nucleotidase